MRLRNCFEPEDYSHPTSGVGMPTWIARTGMDRAGSAPELARIADGQLGRPGIYTSTSSR